jgi:uncharacterized membrane protein
MLRHKAGVIPYARRAESEALAMVGGSIRLFFIIAAAALLVTPRPALAWRHGGWGPGIVIGIPPPVMAPPGYYDGPPAGYYDGPPPGYYSVPQPLGQACYAGPYVCPLDEPGPLGAPCSCPTERGRAGGRIG